MSQLQDEISAIKESVKHHRIAFYALLLFIVLLTLTVIILVKAVSPTPQNPIEDASQETSQQGASVELQTDYKNPFDKDTQYTNPFSQYKNPFDTIR